MHCTALTANSWEVQAVTLTALWLLLMLLQLCTTVGQSLNLIRAEASSSASQWQKMCTFLPHLLQPSRVECTLAGGWLGRSEEL